MIVTRTRVGDHIYKMSELFIIFLIVGLGINALFLETHCSGRTCFRMIKLLKTPGILFIAPIKHHGKKQQNLSKFEVAIRIVCAGCRSASSLVAHLA